jgi:histidinol-phosphatase (PHP family)
VLAQRPFERVLGSLHSVIRDDELIGVNRVLKVEDPHPVMREYFTDLLGMLEGSSVFDVLAHCDYPRRHWPHSADPYTERDFEQGYQAAFAALAASERALEINTRRPVGVGGPGALVAPGGWSGGLLWQRRARAMGRWTALRPRGRSGDSAGFRPGRDRWDFYRA